MGILVIPLFLSVFSMRTICSDNLGALWNSFSEGIVTSNYTISTMVPSHLIEWLHMQLNESTRFLGVEHEQVLPMTGPSGYYKEVSIENRISLRLGILTWNGAVALATAVIQGVQASVNKVSFDRAWAGIFETQLGKPPASEQRWNIRKI